MFLQDGGLEGLHTGRGTPEMDDGQKTKSQLIQELSDLRRRLAALEAAEADHNRAERALRDSEEAMRTLLNAPPDLAILVDPEGTLLALNDAASRRLGEPAERILGTCAFDLFPDARAESGRARLREVLRSKAPVRFEERRGETLFDCACFPVLDAEGSAERVAIMVRDVTNCRRWERALQESEETVRALLNAPSDSAMLFDLEGTVLSLNAVAAERLGKSVEELIGNCIFDFIPPELAAARRARLNEVVRSRQAVRFEEARTGIEFQSTCYPVFGATGEVERVAVFAIDVTQRKRAEEAVRRKQQRLRRLLDMYERDRKLVAYEIHDGFVQPLAGALMNLEAAGRVLRQQYPDPAQGGYDRAVELLRGSLDQARRLMSGLRPAVLEKFGLKAALESLVCESRTREALEIEYAHDVQFDRLPAPLETAVYRIVQESLANASHHSKSPMVRIGITQRDDRVSVEVEDWGVGFDLAKVEPDCFGLDGIRERARLFGGQATIQTAPGQGTRVSAELPI